GRLPGQRARRLSDRIGDPGRRRHDRQHLRGEDMTAELDRKIVETLSGISTATLTTVLLKKGLRNVWVRGSKPLSPGQPRLVGRAFTLRFVPAREDLATPESWSKPISTRAAIEAMPEGCICVAD